MDCSTSYHSMPHAGAARQTLHGLLIPYGCKALPSTWLLLSIHWAISKSECCLCREVVEKVQSLKAQLSDTQTELASLQQQYSLSEKRLVRASKLISALGDEAGRWGISADTLATRLQLLIGQSLWHAFSTWYMTLARLPQYMHDAKGMAGESWRSVLKGGGRIGVR